MNFTKSKPELPGFQLTPMIDVVFLLLCFFVTAAVYSQWESELDIQLPTSSAADIPRRFPGEIIVNVAQDGTVVVNQNELSLEQLGAKCSQISKLYPGQPIVVRADRLTPWESVVAVMDVCRLAGIANIGFATSMEEFSDEIPEASVRQM